ncbi:MAG: hypothetical protein RLZZ490_969 [Cyanobacteriota bacterium]|jgi:hypothetical protein
MTETPQPYKTGKDDFREDKPFMASFEPEIPFNASLPEMCVYADDYLYALGEYLASTFDEHYLNMALNGLNRGIWDTIRAGKQPPTKPFIVVNEEF